jgi:hypothetical protein
MPRIILLPDAIPTCRAPHSHHLSDLLEQLPMCAREPVAFAVPFGMPAYDAIRHSARFAAVIKGFGLDPAGFRATP